MKRILGCLFALAFLGGAEARGHHGHAEAAHHPLPLDVSVPHPFVPVRMADQDGASGRTTGAGPWAFRPHPRAPPPEMEKHLHAAHGGFAPDPEGSGGDGSTYFSLSGVGILRIAPDVSRIHVVGGDPAFTGVNIHNTCLFRAGGRAYLALPSDRAQKLFITDLSGRLIRTFPNPYGEAGGAFRVCDAEFVEGRLFAPNGYADNVCFVCDPLRGADGDPTRGVWDTFRFGGKGREHGRFGTAHGITRVPGSNVFTIADRANSRLESYAVNGHYIGGLNLPAGCLPCDIDYHGRFAVVACLEGPGGSTPAPIYILEDGNIVAELNLGKDLMLPGFTHIHNAVFRVVPQPDGTERWYVLVYAWNPGNLAILARVTP